MQPLSLVLSNSQSYCDKKFCARLLLLSPPFGQLIDKPEAIRGYARSLIELLKFLVKDFVLAFFKRDSSNKNEEQKDNDFKSIIIDTQNVADEIKNVASSNNLNTSDLSFRVLKVITSYRSHKGEEYKELDDKSRHLFDDNDFMLNPELRIKQHYKVEIFRKSDISNDEIIPDIVLSGNKLLTKVVATIKKNIDVKYF